MSGLFINTVADSGDVNQWTGRRKRMRWKKKAVEEEVKGKMEEKEEEEKEERIIEGE